MGTIIASIIINKMNNAKINIGIIIPVNITTSIPMVGPIIGHIMLKNAIILFSFNSVSKILKLEYIIPAIIIPMA